MQPGNPYQTKSPRACYPSRPDLFHMLYDVLYHPAKPFLNPLNCDVLLLGTNDRKKPRCEVFMSKNMGLNL